MPSLVRSIIELCIALGSSPFGLLVVRIHTSHSRRLQALRHWGSLRISASGHFGTLRFLPDGAGPKPADNVSASERAETR